MLINLAAHSYSSPVIIKPKAINPERIGNSANVAFESSLKLSNKSTFALNKDAQPSSTM